MDIDQIANNVIGTTIGAIYNKGAATTQYNRQRELMGLQLENQKILNQQGHKMQMDMWQKTNFPAQVAMLKEAGLNPGLMYAKGGAGGSTGSQTGGGASSGQAGQAAPMDISGLLNLELVKSQTNKNNADAKKANTDADKAAGVDTRQKTEETNNLKANTDLITSQIQTETVKREGIAIDNALKKIDLYINDKTKEFKIEQVEAELDQIRNSNLLIIENLRGEQIENDKKEELIQSQIDLNNQNVATSYWQAAAAKAGISLSNAQIQNMLRVYDLEVKKLSQNIEITKLNNEQSGANAKIHADAMIYAAQVSGTGHLLGDVNKALAGQFGKKTLPPSTGGGTKNVTINNYGPSPKRK
jgi:hypothetical protein